MNKKNRFFSTMLATLVGSAIWIPSAQADFIPYILDTKIGEAKLSSSGDAAELAAMQDAVRNFTGSDIVLVQDDKINKVDFTPIENGVGSGQWYLDINPNTPGYFLLNFGIGGISGVTANTFFFENIGEMTKLVWSNEQVQNITGGGGNNTNIGRLSHYVTYDPKFNQTGEIPEPATLALVGLGLFAIGAMRRRKS
jgi:hypothetical protein